MRDKPAIYDNPKLAQQNSTMLYVDGSKTAFRCACGCNVFQRIVEDGRDKFECNSCHDTYIGEKE